MIHGKKVIIVCAEPPQCLYSVLCTEWEYCAAGLIPYILEKQKGARLSHICTVNGVQRFYLFGKVNMNSKTIYLEKTLIVLRASGFKFAKLANIRL